MLAVFCLERTTPGLPSCPCRSGCKSPFSLSSLLPCRGVSLSRSWPWLSVPSAGTGQQHNMPACLQQRLVGTNLR